MRNRVDVYTRPRCLFCHQVLDLLRLAKVEFHQIEIADRAEQDGLIAQYNAASFPLVIVQGTYIGGYAHVLHLHSKNYLSKLSGSEELQASPVPERVPMDSPPVETRSPPSGPSYVGIMARLQQSLKEPDPQGR